MIYAKKKKKERKKRKRFKHLKQNMLISSLKKVFMLTILE